MARKSGQIVAKGPGKWLVRLTLGTDAVGGRRTHSRTIVGTRKDAQRLLNKLQRDRDLGLLIEPSDQAVGTFLKKWLAESVSARVATKTASDYAALVRLHLEPALGHLKLSQLTPVEIQGLYREMLDRGLSARTVRYAHTVLHSALDQAVKWQLIIRNPARLVDLPRLSQTEMKTLSKDQANAFLTAAREDRYSALWELLLMTGMRPGEALALKWSDIDGTKIRIQRNLVRHSNGEHELKEPKTPRARRTVVLPSSTVEALQAHRRVQIQERLKAGPGYENLDLVFAASNGSPLDWRVVVQRHFNQVIKKAGLPRIRPYDLRHTSATLLLAAGVNVKVVSERLGHQTAALTLDTYSHVLPDMQEKAAEQIGSMFG